MTGLQTGNWLPAQRHRRRRLAPDFTGGSGSYGDTTLPCASVGSAFTILGKAAVDTADTLGSVRRRLLSVLDSTGTTVIGPGIEGDPARFAVRARSTSSNTYTGDTIPLQTPFAWAVVYNGTTLSCVVDGVAQTLVTPIVLTSSRSGYVVFAEWPGDAAFRWDGRMWDTAIFATALSLSEINAYQRGVIRGNEANLLACWPLDEGAGNALRDVGPGGYNGTISGVSWRTVPGRRRTS